MMIHQMARGSLAIVSLAALAACADGTTSTSPAANRFSGITTTAAISPTVPAGGEFWLCKDGTDPGSFTFDVTYTHTKGTGPDTPPVASSSVTLSVGECALVASTPVSSGDVYLANATEQAVTNWSVTAISAIKGDGSTVPIGVDLGNRSATGARFGNDRGTTVTFFNTLAPPPPPSPEGCSPGYYKKHVQPSSNTLLSDLFTNTGSTLTVQQALFLEGGPSLQDKKNILLRQAAAAFLNIGYLGSSYPLSLSELQDLVNTALASGNANTITAAKDVIAGYNNLEGPRC